MVCQQRKTLEVIILPVIESVVESRSFQDPAQTARRGASRDSCGRAKTFLALRFKFPCGRPRMRSSRVHPASPVLPTESVF